MRERERETEMEQNRKTKEAREEEVEGESFRLHNLFAHFFFFSFCCKREKTRVPFCRIDDALLIREPASSLLLSECARPDQQLGARRKRTRTISTTR